MMKCDRRGGLMGWFLFALSTTLGCHAPTAPGTALVATSIAPGSSDPHAAFDRILAAHVREELVDYLTIRRDSWTELERYLDDLAAVDTAALSAPDRLAYWLNLYNATMIRAIVARFRAGYAVSEAKWGIFDEALVRMRDRTSSLNQLEHDVIRPLGDARIHTALVCGARSCPPLLPRAFRGSDLARVLDENVKRWLLDPRRNRIDLTAKRLELSAIFDWYAADFGGAGGVVAWVDAALPEQVAGFAVSFLPYSWDLNIAPPASGTWVSVLRGGTALTAEDDPTKTLATVKKDEVVEVVGVSGGHRLVVLPFGRGRGRLAERDVEAYR